MYIYLYMYISRVNRKQSLTGDDYLGQSGATLPAEEEVRGRPGARSQEMESLWH